MMNTNITTLIYNGTHTIKIPFGNPIPLECGDVLEIIDYNLRFVISIAGIYLLLKTESGQVMIVRIGEKKD